MYFPRLGGGKGGRLLRGQSVAFPILTTWLDVVYYSHPILTL